MATVAAPLGSQQFTAERRLIESQLKKLLPCADAASSSSLASAMRYAVFGGGQRIRPVLALRVASVLRIPQDRVIAAAACVEILHCASLIVDDLPCMDDACTRRGRASVHVAWGESTAILAAFGLVALAARTCSSNLSFQNHLLKTLDLTELIGGQALDLTASDGSEDHRVRTAAMKTAPLFRLAARAATCATPEPPALGECLEKFSFDLGVAFQLADDLEDGEARAAEAFEASIERAATDLSGLGGRAAPLRELVTYIHDKAWQQNRCHR